MTSKPEADFKKIATIWDTIKFFKENNIEGEDMNIVVQGLTFENMLKDEYVFKAGTLGDKFYIILKGSVRILIPIKDKVQKEEDRKSLIFDHTQIKRQVTRRASKIMSESEYKEAPKNIPNRPTPIFEDYDEYEYKEVAILTGL